MAYWWEGVGLIKLTPALQLKVAYCDNNGTAWQEMLHITTNKHLFTPLSLRYLVNQQCIKPLCDLLNVNDGKIIHVALDGLDNILRAGHEEFQSDTNLTSNPYCILIEEGDGT